MPLIKIVFADQVVTLLSTIVSHHKNGVTLLLTPNCQCGADVRDTQTWSPHSRIVNICNVKEENTISS